MLLRVVESGKQLLWLKSVELVGGGETGLMGLVLDDGIELEDEECLRSPVSVLDMEWGCGDSLIPALLQALVLTVTDGTESLTFTDGME